MQRRVTSHDVARLAGVSQSTVSLVLNGRTDTRIPDATRQRVFEAARALNYTRNAAAHALLTGRTHRFGIVPIHPNAFADNGSYYGALTTSFIQGALRHNYNLLLHCVAHLHWEALYRDILSGSTDGVILIGRRADDPLTKALLEAGFPVVCVSYQPDLPAFYSVDCDNEQGGYLAVKHLLELGHRRIAYLFARSEHTWEVQRYIGAQRAIAESNLPPESLLRLGANEKNIEQKEGKQEGDEPSGDRDAPLTDERVVSLLEAHSRDRATRPTALVCPDDQQGERLIRQLLPRGIRIPDDIALVSYNSTEVCERTQPRQSSVWQPLMEIGHAAVDTLIDLFEGREVASGTRRFPMRLDVRESSG